MLIDDFMVQNNIFHNFSSILRDFPVIKIKIHTGASYYG